MAREEQMKAYIFHIVVPFTKDSEEEYDWRKGVRASLDYKMDQLMDAPEEDWQLMEVPEGYPDAYVEVKFDE